MHRHLFTCILAIALFCYSTKAQNTAEDVFSEAKKELNQENYQKAIELLTAVLNNPEKNNYNFYHYETYRFRSFCYYTLKNYAAASDDVDSLLHYQNFLADKFFVNPSKKTIRAMAFCMKGECKQFTAKYKEAIAAYDSALYYKYEDPGSAYWNRGWCYENLGKYKEADKDYEKAIPLRSDKNELAVIYRNRGNCQFELDNDALAISFYTKSISYNPGDYETYLKRGRCYFDMKDPANGRADLMLVIANEKDDIKRSQVYADLGNLELSILDYARSMTNLNKALEIDPLNGNAYYIRAQVNGYLKNYTASIADCNTAGRIYKDSNNTAKLMQQRAWCYTKSGNYNEAVKEYEEIIKMYPNYSNTHYKLGRLVLIEMKDNDKGKAILTNAARLALEAKDTSEYCYIMVFNGGKEEAIRKNAELIKTKKGDAYEYQWALYNMACMYALAGDDNKAIEYLDKAFAAGFDNWFHLSTDDDLAGLSNLPEWRSLLTKYKVPAPKF